MPRVFDRATLDEYLEDVDLTLLLVVGEDGTDAEKIHDKAEEKVDEEWRVCLLMEDDALLEPGELEAWKLADQRYASLGLDEDEERVPAEKGRNAHLMRQDGQASILKIRHAFAKADEL